MTRHLGLLACALLVACGNDDPDTDTDTDTDGPADCDNAIEAMHPEADAADVYYRTTIDFTLDTVAGDEAITVSQDGTDVSGTTTIDGQRVVFTPSAPLASNATYDVTLDWECGPTNVSWTTSDVGDPADAASLEGNAYSLDLASGRFVQPPGVGDLIQSQLDTEVLIGVTSATETEITMMGAVADASGLQDMCMPSIDFPVAADFGDNPYFEVGPDDVTIEAAGYEVTIDDLVVSGAFSADGSRIEGAVVAGSVDTRGLVGLVGTGEGDLCAVFAGFEVNCEPCSSDNEPFCVSIFVDTMTAELASGVTLVPVTEEDVAADPSCVDE